MIYTSFVELLSLILQPNFQNHSLSGSGEDFKVVFFFLLHVFIATEAILVICSGHLYTFSFPLPKDASHEVRL